MDSLINALDKVTVNESFDEQLDKMIDSFEVNLDIDYDHEWEELSKNYSRIIYIDRFIKKHQPTNKKFYNIVDTFLCDIDSKIQYYLREIDWYNNPEFEGEFHLEVMEIKENFEHSLNKSSTEKIKFLLKAFNILVPIIEEFRKERIVIEVDDEFKQQFKKRRIN